MILTLVILYYNQNYLNSLLLFICLGFVTSWILQLDYVKGVSVDFLQKHLNPSNCFGIKEFVDFYNCMELLSSSEEYIKTHFL